jgi:group II intron reverse transcriptase/maturase
MFALFSGLIGTAFSVIIRLELSAPGVQYISDNQLYNSIITAHAIMMSAPLCAEPWLVIWLTNRDSCVKDCQAGEAELHEETQTAKLTGKEIIGSDAQLLDLISHLSCIPFRLTNLARKFHQNWIFAKWADRANALSLLILSSVSGLSLQDNGILHREDQNCARNHMQSATSANCGIAYGYQSAPKNSRLKVRGPIIGGDGVAILGYASHIWRATVVNPQIKTFSSKAGPIIRVPRGSDEKNISNQLDINIKTISNMKNLVTAYESIKSNPGNMTHGVDKTTLDGIDLKYLEKIQAELRAGTFEFKPARRIQIPKPGKTETRPLTIASPREKVVQKAILLVMEQIYERKFLDTSHGFRPGRGTHTAMKNLETQFQSVHYFIEADFSKAFDTISHQKLMEIIKEEVKCEKTLKLIKSGLKAGYIEFGSLHDNLSIGTPQGSILSPLLCNIFLHKLDTYIEEIKKEHQKGTRRQRNEENLKLQNKLKYWRKKGYNISKPLEYLEMLKQLRNTPSIKRDKSYIRIHYIRYADDFVIGIEGGYNLAKIILQKVEKFVNEELNLKFNPDKTGITNYSTNVVKFLGFTIRAPYFLGKVKPLESVMINGKNILRRKKIRISINMDLEKVIKKLQANGFIKKRLSHSEHHKLIYRGTFKGNLINMDHADIIRYYNAVVRGIFNYYSFARNRVDVTWIGWLIKESCGLTLARKFKLKTLANTFKEFGKDLGVRLSEDKRISFVDIKYKAAINIAKAVAITKDPLKNLEEVWNAKFTKTNLNAPCVICGSEERVEMHHVRKIRDLKNPKNKLDFYTRQMAAINRKQVPLCRDHHIRLHNNTWTLEERRAFNYEARKKDKKSKN